MNHVDESITAAMRDRATGPVHVEELLGSARSRGQRRRTVQRTLAAAGVGAAILAVLGAVAVLPLGGGGSGADGNAPAGVAGPPGSGTAAATPYDGVRPPAATGAPALGQGGRPGQDHNFHLDVTEAKPQNISWRSGPTWEYINTETAAGHFIASIGDSEASLDLARAADGSELYGTPTIRHPTVDGKPATYATSGLPGEARWAYLRWQPIPGVWAQVLTSFASDPGKNIDTDEAGIIEMARLLRFDRVYRCAVNFTLGWTPPGTAVASCGFNGGPGPSSRVYLTTGAARYSIFVYPAAASAAKPVQPNAEYAGTAMELREGRVRRIAGDWEVMLDPQVPLADNDALRLAAGVQPVEAPYPAGWPGVPLH